MLSFKEAIFRGTEILRSGGNETARLDAEVLLAYCLDISRIDLYLKDEPISTEKFNEYLTLVRRRAAREPVAYITGEREFMSLPFKVNSSVLIPRPETEIIVEKAIEIKPSNIVDVGTGSGAIGISAAYYLPESIVSAIDISDRALEVAKGNALLHGVADRIRFYHGNLLEPLDTRENFSCFDLITANLPYIPTSEMKELPFDVRGYEPAGALDGGGDGLDLYRRLFPAAARVLKPGGCLLIEFGYRQDVELVKMLEDYGFDCIEVIKDLAGLNRVIKAVRMQSKES